MYAEASRRATAPAVDSLVPDTLLGAAAIAEFLYGDRGLRRKVYHLAETTKLPVFRLGSRLCARRSVLIAWISEQEARNGGRRSTSQAPAAAGASPHNSARRQNSLE